MSNIYKLHTANVFLNGSSMCHVASEITLPAVKRIKNKHAPVGLKFSMEVPLGVEPMETKIKGDFDPGFVAASINNSQTHDMHIYSDLVEYDDAKGVLCEKRAICYMKVMFTEMTPGALKNGEAMEVDFVASVWAYKLEIEGVTLFDLNPLSNKHEVLGTNLNATNNQVIAR
jgi:P2 family phage contractile tail tube protein